MRNGQIKPAERMKIERQSMPMQDGSLRCATFTEVNLGLPEQIARLEAQRCLQCKDAKCVNGCPVRIDIPGFIDRVAHGDLPGAAGLLLRDNALPGVSGRVCPQEKQCECLCIRGKKSGCSVAIGYLERFVADWARTTGLVPANTGCSEGSEQGHISHLTSHISESPQRSSKFRVAIVGSGPAGLTAAGELARRGHGATIFEALHEPGGVLVYGIPEFRLPKEIVRGEVDALRRRGVEIVCNVIIGQTYTIDELLTEEGFDAVFIANGAGLPVFLGIPGENHKGVYSANEYLTRVNLMRGYLDHAETPVPRADEVVVIGGGNTAMDAVRTARRMGARRATLVYRRSRAEMPARIEEIHHAEEEGIRFEFLTNPTAIRADQDGWVRGLACERMQLGEPDASGRARPIPVPGSAFEIPCAMVIEAVGTRANPLLTQTTPDLKINRKGYIEIDENGMTSKPGVFAGGDIVRGAATVILAMGDGKRAAGAIDAYLQTRRPRVRAAEGG